MDVELKRGGVRQRQARRELASILAAPPDHAIGKSELVKLLVSTWAWGQMSPQMVQKIADAAARDLQNFRDPSDHQITARMADLDAVAGIGDHGRSAI